MTEGTDAGLLSVLLMMVTVTVMVMVAMMVVKRKEMVTKAWGVRGSVRGREAV
jgi:hypothetical protein